MPKTRQYFQIDRPDVADLTTTINDYVLVPFPLDRETTRNYWDTWHLAGVKLLRFSAADNNLKVKVMGSIDGTNFTETVEAEFSVTTTTPVTKRILAYWPYLQVQVKPAVAAQHGTLSILAIGTAITAEADTELTASIDPAGLATEATQADVKTAVEALAVATPDTAAGDLADINAASASIDGKLPALVGGKIPVDASVSIDSVDIGDVDITEFPAGNLGQQAKAASLSVAPATDITDPTYIGDVKFGEELPAGTQLIGKVGIDQTTPGTTNLVNVDGGASQTTDIKVTLDSESVAVTGPLTNAELTAQALATEATLGTMQADIALMKADLAAILAILES